MKNVKNNAKPIITWFGGIVFVANAVRTNESTTTTRVKHVIKIKIEGAIDNTVSNNNNFTDVDTLEALLSEK